MRVTKTTHFGYLLGCSILLKADTMSAQLTPQPPVRVGPPAPVSTADTGSLVRAWRKDRYASPRYLEGSLRAVTPQSLTVRSAQRGVVISLRLDSISKLEIATGRAEPGRTIRIVATAGGIAGLLAGYELGSAFYRQGGLSGDGDFELAVGIAVTGMLVGAGVGSFIGAILPADRTWQEVPVPR